MKTSRHTYTIPGFISYHWYQYISPKFHFFILLSQKNYTCKDLPWITPQRNKHVGDVEWIFINTHNFGLLFPLLQNPTLNFLKYCPDPMDIPDRRRLPIHITEIPLWRRWYHPKLKCSFIFFLSVFLFYAPDLTLLLNLAIGVKQSTLTPLHFCITKSSWKSPLLVKVINVKRQ